MNKINKYSILFFLAGMIFIFHSCIEKFTPMLNESDVQNLLVVEGQITDEAGPFKVRLTNSVSVYSDPNILNKDHPVVGAGVQIFDDKGNTFTLFETENGWYETENRNLKGVIGNTYSLSISTADNLQYESTPVLMQEAPEIEKIHSEIVKNSYFDENGSFEENQVNILVDTKVTVDNNVYLKWELEETWEFEMPSRVLVNHGSDEGDPPPTIETIDIDSERKFCWVSENSSNLIVESSAGYLNNQIKNYVLQTIGSSSDRLNKKYSILVKQYSISHELYTMFKKLREANEDVAGIYSKNPGQIFGNITCCNNEEKALGYFFAAGVKEKRIFIDHLEYNIPNGDAYSGCGWTTKKPRYLDVYYYGMGPEVVYSTNIYCTDCRKRGTNVKPDFWE